jgi:hypothetical protein
MYHAQYRPVTERRMVLNGRVHVQVARLSPWTVHRDGKQVTVQGRHTTTYVVTSEATADVRFASREVNPPRPRLTVRGWMAKAHEGQESA